MGNFSFTATAQCNKCGNFLGSSEEECDHDGKEVHQQMFRRISDGEPHTIAVQATMGYKWYALEEELGEDWIAYQYLGPRPEVQSMVGTTMWESIDDVPHRSMSTDAPSDVGEDDE